jgi:hypothetical protein
VVALGRHGGLPLQFYITLAINLKTSSIIRNEKNRINDKLRGKSAMHHPLGVAVLPKKRDAPLDVSIVMIFPQNR